MDERSDLEPVLLDVDQLNTAKHVAPAEFSPTWESETVLFGDIAIVLHDPGLTGARARVLRMLIRRQTGRLDSLAGFLGESTDVLTDLLDGELLLDQTRCEWWKNRLGISWKDFFDLDDKFVSEDPWTDGFQSDPAPAAEKSTTRRERPVRGPESVSFRSVSPADVTDRLIQLRSRRAEHTSVPSPVTWDTAQDRAECQEFSRKQLGPSLLAVLNSTGLITERWLNDRVPIGFNRQGLLAEEKRKGVPETTVPVSFVKQLLKFALLTKSNYDLCGRAVLRDEYAALATFCGLNE